MDSLTETITSSPVFAREALSVNYFIHRIADLDIQIFIVLVLMKKKYSLKNKIWLLPSISSQSTRQKGLKPVNFNLINLHIFARGHLISLHLICFSPDYASI